MVFFLGLLARYFWSLTYTWGYISYGFVLALGKLSLNVLVQYSLSFYCEIHPILLALIEIISSLMYTNSSICKFKREILKLVLNVYIFRINQLVEDIWKFRIWNHRAITQESGTTSKGRDLHAYVSFTAQTTPCCFFCHRYSNLT